jgi:hypothetical protein
LQHSNTQQQEQQQQQQLPQQLDEQQLAALAAAAAELDAADAAPMFLERVVLWWCGVPADAALELQSILHLYAGVRFPELCDSTTHIMVRFFGTAWQLQPATTAIDSCCGRSVFIIAPVLLLYILRLNFSALSPFCASVLMYELSSPQQVTCC